MEFSLLVLVMQIQSLMLKVKKKNLKKGGAHQMIIIKKNHALK